MPAGWRVRRGRGIPDVGAGWERAVFVAERAIKHEVFLAPIVCVCRKGAAGGVTDDAGGAGDFFADAVKHLAIDAGHGGGHPLGLVEADDDACVELGIDAHGVTSGLVCPVS